MRVRDQQSTFYIILQILQILSFNTIQLQAQAFDLVQRPRRCVKFRLVCDGRIYARNTQTHTQATRTTRHTFGGATISSVSRFQSGEQRCFLSALSSMAPYCECTIFTMLLSATIYVSSYYYSCLLLGPFQKEYMLPGIQKEYKLPQKLFLPEMAQYCQYPSFQS